MKQAIPALAVAAIISLLCNGAARANWNSGERTGQTAVVLGTVLNCVVADDGFGYNLVYSRPAFNASAAPLLHLATFAECPASRQLIHVADKSEPGKVSPPKDRREESPLSGIAVPFDFKKTMNTAGRREAVTSPDDELAERSRIREEARWLFITYDEGNVDKLEGLFKQYREGKQRTESGVWKLSKAYNFLETLERDWTRKEDPNLPDWTMKRLDEWKSKYPASPTPYLFDAAIKFYKATGALNDRMARNTYPGGIPALKAKVKEARSLLESNKAVASADPQYYALLILIMRNSPESIEDILQVAVEGAERFPEYLDVYFEASNAIGQLSRKPFDDVEALANTAVEKTRSGLGDEVYARIYWNAIQTIFGMQSVPSLKWDWAKMKSSMDTVLSRYPVQWNIHNFAQFSCFAGDAEATRKYMDQVKGLPLAIVWSQAEFFDACRQFADATPENPAERDTRKAVLKPR